MDPAYEEEYRGYRIEVRPEEDGYSPREWDNLGTMVCWHRRYALGDVKSPCRPDDYIRNLAQEYTEADMDDADMVAVWDVIHEHYVILPLRLVDHSGITMSIGSGAYPCDPGGWDSGQVGWIYVSLERLREETTVKPGQTDEDRARECLETEVHVYDLHLRGEEYYYSVVAPDGERVGGCGGYFGGPGDTDTSWDYMLGAARAEIDLGIGRVRAEHTGHVKAWIRNRVPLGYRECCPASGLG